MPFRHKPDLLGLFAQHRVAANLLMVVMILAGMWGLSKLNTQFFPSFALDFITVAVPWTGANAEDVESGITNVLERELRTLDSLRKLTSTSAEGAASVVMEYEEGTDMSVALDQVKERVGLIRNLPGSAEEPKITRIIRYEPVARVLITGGLPLQQLRFLAKEMERELLDRGIAKVQFTGLPADEIAIQVPSARLRELNLSLADIAHRVAMFSQDLPAGTIGRNDVARQLRAVQQRRSPQQFEDIPIQSTQAGQRLALGDIAQIARRPRARQVTLAHQGRAAIEMQLLRTETGDSLKSAAILDRWLTDVRPTLPPSVDVVVFDQQWRLIKERIMLLLKNGGGGLVLVVGILFLLLHGRVAFWVAVGIPVSFMATLGLLYLLGGSINMVSLFALIMALGIIVDDAIVVGEDALAHYQAGEPALQAAEGGARRMLAPVMSSSLTTMAAFVPLMLVSGIIGKILFDIPLIVICVIGASLVESFLILPGHLRHTFTNIQHQTTSGIRKRLDEGFAAFRDGPFRRLVTQSVRHSAITVSTTVALLLLCFGLIVGGRIAFNFFPTAETTIVYANATFVAGTRPERVADFLRSLSDSLRQAEAQFNEDLIVTQVTRYGMIQHGEDQPVQKGDGYGSIFVQLREPDERNVRNPTLIRAWRKRVVEVPGLESLVITERRGGPPGRDLDLRLTGSDAGRLKSAALRLAETLKTIPGVGGVDDDMPYGPEQLIYSLTPEGETQGLTVADVGHQLRAAYDGELAQIFQDGDDEIEVRVVLPNAERHNLNSLENLGMLTPAGGTVPLMSVVELRSGRGFEMLRHADGRLSVRVSADVDAAVNNANIVIDQLKLDVLPDLERDFGVDYLFEGRAADQEETLADMRRGMLFALAMIYIVLAWVFSSYGWPLVVMAAIPFGLIGAIAGHWLMDIDLTILSLFGLFGLSGIVVNDSIVLVVFYKHLRESGMAMSEAIIEAACRRLRAVLLTSLTTIAGLTPLMFETSLQAQFLIPMAVSISFGLGFATLLVLLVIPALLQIHERIGMRLLSGRQAATA